MSGAGSSVVSSPSGGGLTVPSPSMASPVSPIPGIWSQGAILLTLVFLWGCGGGPSPEDTAQEGISEKAAPVLTLTPQESGTSALLQAVSPVDDQVVWVSGHEGSWAHTRDGGDNWTASVMSGEETLQFRDVEAFDENTAYLMSAGNGGLSRIYRTDDGGESWRLQYMADDPGAFLDCMAFWDRDRGIAYGDAVDGLPFILLTRDGGESWTRAPSGAMPAALEGEGGFAASGTCVATGEGGRAWIATGAGPLPRILSTEDWGESWTAVEIPVVGGSSSGLFTIRVGSDGLGVALGGTVGGDTLRTANVAVTEDLGANWKAQGHPAMLGPIYGSALVETDGGWGVAAAGPGGLDWSPDMGGSWQTVDSLTYWAVAFASPEKGWAVGPGGRITRLSIK